MKKKIVAILVCGVIAAGLIGCGSSSEDTSEESEEVEADEEVEDAESFDLAVYEDKVNECREAMYSAMSPLLNVYNYQCNYWDSYASISGQKPDELKEKGFEWLEENAETDTLETTEQLNDEIKNDYREIALTEVEGKEAEMVETAIEDMYNAYTTIYDSVMNPPDDIDTFKENVGSATTTLSQSNDDLKLYLGVEDEE